jgi:NAD(P)-dependent dehydrogenase (short-subunit alcohol dehydrogenase family)
MSDARARAVTLGHLSVDDDAWNVMFNRNMMAMIRSCRAVLPTMIEKRAGSIVTITSTNSRQPDPFLIDYSAAKAALLSVSKSLSIEYGPLGIRVNCVSPGPTRTPAFMRSIGVIMAAKWGMSSEEALTHYATKVQTMALGRVGDPEDVAPIVGFLASDLARQVTGSEYTVNGGLLKAQ